MSIFDSIANVFKPVAATIDKLTLTKQEKEEFKIKLTEAENTLALAQLKKDEELFKAQSAIIIAETQSGNKLTSSVRPIIVYNCLAILNVYVIGSLLSKNGIPIPERVLLLIMTIILGATSGYVGTRGLQKIAHEKAVANKK